MTEPYPPSPDPTSSGPTTPPPVDPYPTPPVDPYDTGAFDTPLPPIEPTTRYQPPPPLYPPPAPQYPPPPGPPGPPTYATVPYAAQAAWNPDVDPVTGRPWSTKSKTSAGLLQLLPGFFLGLGGLGRLYAGQTTLGVVQLGLSVIGWICFWCGWLLFVPFFGYAAICWYFAIDGIVILAGRPVDGDGRALRS